MSKGSQKKGKCIYCGYEGFITRDHIPPQCFFPEPRPSNLITVPCCKKCHTKWSNDDEYFRAVIVSSINVDHDSNAQKINQALLRSMKNPNKKGFASMIRQSLAEVEVKTPSGIYLGKTPAIKVDKKRFDSVAKRILKGLYFYEKGHSIPKGYEVHNYFSQFAPDRSLMEILKTGRWSQPKIIGDNIFGYCYAVAEDNANIVVFQSKFYNGLDFYGGVIPEQS